MKVTMFMTSSLNGFIADEKGSEDFLSDENWETFSHLAKKFGCIVWGRKTYEKVKSWDKKYLKVLKDTKIIIVSKQKVNGNIISAGSPIEAIKRASALGFKEILLSGGSELNSSFMNENLIDEIILNVEPVLLGEGIKLFAETKFEKRLEIQDCKKLDEGIIQLRYSVNKNG